MYATSNERDKERECVLLVIFSNWKISSSVLSFMFFLSLCGYLCMRYYHGLETSVLIAAYIATDVLKWINWGHFPATSWQLWLLIQRVLIAICVPTSRGYCCRRNKHFRLSVTKEPKVDGCLHCVKWLKNSDVMVTGPNKWGQKTR